MAARIRMIGVVLALWLPAYLLLGRWVEPAGARVLRTPLDDAIPFWPASVYLYSWAYTSTLFPVFVVRSTRLFRRVAVAFGTVTVISLALFALFPVTAVGLRPDVATLDPRDFTQWGVLMTYAADAPVNLFPSLHLSFATLAALSAFTARRLYGWLALPMVVAIAVSICTMKQHYVADGVAGVALAVTAWALIIRPWYPSVAEQREGAAWGWRGPVGYLAFHATVYYGFWLAFLWGVVPT